jgi:hypothetical protein
MIGRAACAMLVPGVARLDVPGVRGEGIPDVGVSALRGGAAASVLNVAVWSAAPSRPATITAVSSPPCVARERQFLTDFEEARTGRLGRQRRQPGGADVRALAVHSDIGPVIPEVVTGAGVDGAQQPHVSRR